MPTWTAMVAVLVPVVGGWISSMSMRGQVENKDGDAWYQIIKKPRWTPPNWIFAPVWVVLYTTMGYASYMIYRICGGFSDDSNLPLALYAIQLLFNWTWTPIFFKFHALGWALLHMLILDVVTVGCAYFFFIIESTTLLLLAPYLGWLVFSTCLNYSVWRLNTTEHEEDMFPIHDKKTSDIIIVKY